MVTWREDYYERFWNGEHQVLSPAEEDRILTTISFLPQDCDSILDVGCGDGRIANRLVAPGKSVCGLERSDAALRYVAVHRVRGDVCRLPFRDRSFDLVLCCEVLEHLGYVSYPQALYELARVSNRCIVVTVPNAQDMQRGLIKCSYCGCMFHAHQHLRSFNGESLRSLLPEYELVRSRGCGLAVDYPRFVESASRLLRGAPEMNRDASCPDCGYSPVLHGSTPSSERIHDRDGVWFKAARLTARRVLPKRRRAAWLIAEYRRKGHSQPMKDCPPAEGLLQ